LQPNEEKLQPKPRGAPKGNQNAKGGNGGAPKGNQNNFKHGIYRKLLLETMSEDERQLYQDTSFDEIQELKETIRLCDIQIIRLMKLTKEAQEKQGGLAVTGVTKIKLSNNSTKYEENTTTTATVATYELILRYNSEIERTKARKIRCLEYLIKLGYEDARLDLDRSRFEFDKERFTKENNTSELADDWVNAVIEADTAINEEVQAYEQK
jgi:uncharacterized protein YjcR